MAKVSELLEIFSARPGRYQLLEKGVELAGFDRFAPGQCALLEVGCGIGDAAAYMATKYDTFVTGLDISQQLIFEAKRRHQALLKRGVLSFRTGNAEDLPFENQSFDGIVSEASFSPLQRKREAVRSYYRVLKKGGRVLVNDFAIRRQTGGSLRKEVAHIPCFQGVDTVENYIGLFSLEGFRTVHCSEEYGELIRISLWIARFLDVSPDKIGTYLAKYYQGGAKKTFCATGQTRENTFFNKAMLTYCQLIFEK
jgi:SAM-dependent methyltransferase